MSGVPHPAVFFVGFVVLVTAIAWAVWRAARDERQDLSAPGASPSRDELATSRRDRGAGSVRGGQRLSLEAVQERAARDALLCAGGGVDVAPVRCPVGDR
jgi:hypothetical protein